MTAESSYKQIALVDRIEQDTFDRIERLRRSGPIFFVACNAGFPWRALYYYYPESPMLILSGCPGRGGAHDPVWLMQNRKTISTPDPGQELHIPVCGKIIWVSWPNQEMEDLPASLRSRRFSWMAVSEAPPGIHFQLGEFRFASSSETCTETPVRSVNTRSLFEIPFLVSRL